MSNFMVCDDHGHLYCPHYSLCLNSIDLLLVDTCFAFMGHCQDNSNLQKKYVFFLNLNTVYMLRWPANYFLSHSKNQLIDSFFSQEGQTDMPLLDNGLN